jgi:RNA polymerase-binding transcription factor DksA
MSQSVETKSNTLRDKVVSNCFSEIKKLNEGQAELRSQLRDCQFDVGDDADNAQIQKDRSFIINQINRTVARIGLLEYAIRNQKDIGYCMNCGDEIPAERYEQNPATTTCVSCCSMNALKDKLLRGCVV